LFLLKCIPAVLLNSTDWYAQGDERIEQMGRMISFVLDDGVPWLKIRDTDKK